MHRTRRALLASLLTAATVVVGYALAGLPNVELMTATVFIAGYLLGYGLGSAVGAGSMLLHSAFNPLGMAHPYLLAGQLAAFALIGAAGAWVGPLIATIRSRWTAALLCGASGFGLTLIYQVIVNVASFYAFSGTTDHLVTYVKVGLAFTALHVVVNTAIFFFAMRPIVSVLERYRREIA